MLSYTSNLLVLLFDCCGNQFQAEIVKITSSSGTSILFYEQVCQLLMGKILLDGIPKEILLDQLTIINVIIFQNDSKIPDEYNYQLLIHCFVQLIFYPIIYVLSLDLSH